MSTPTRLLAGRYRFWKTIPTGTKTVTWLAVDERTDRSVVASALAAPRVTGLEGLVGLSHIHLAALLDVIRDPDPADIPVESDPIRAGAIAVAQYVAGHTLHTRLKTGAAESAEAVGWLYGLADAVHSMHEYGGLHGAISPRSIIVEPKGDEIGPVLTQLLAAPNGPYCAPERLRGGGPDPADDVWALYATLYATLTGAAPFGGATREQIVASMLAGPKTLAERGLDDELLEEIIARGLVPEREERVTDAKTLRDELDEWQRAGRSSQVSVPVLETESAGSDTQTEWDDEDAKTTVTSAAALADMIKGVADKPEQHGPELPARRVPDAAKEPARPALPRPLPPVPARPPGGVPPPSMPPMMSLAPGPVPPDEEDAIASLLDYAEENDPTRIARSADVFARRAKLDTVPPPEGGLADSLEPEAAPDAPPQALIPPPPALPAISAPEPSPPSSAGSLTAPAPSTTSAPRGRSALVAVVFLLVAALAVALFVLVRQKPEPQVPAPIDSAPAAPATTSPAPTPSAAPATGTAPTGDASTTPPRDIGHCAASFFPPGTFTGDEDFSFLCADTDFRGTNSQLYRRIVVAGVGKVTPGMREWSGLGWFEMATTAIVRAGCCPAAPPKIQLPTAPGKCSQLGDVLDKLPGALKPDTVKAVASDYDDAVTCMYKNGVPRRYSYSKQPTGENRLVFEQFLTRAVQRGH